MPTVKADLNNRADLRPVDATPIRAVDAGAVGRAIAQGGIALGGALGEAAQVENRINEIYDDAAVARADTLAMQRLSEARRAALNAQGFDAQAAQENFTKVSEEVGREISASLSNPRQQQMFGQLYARRAVGDFNAVADHATRQVVTARREAAGARVETATTRMVDFYDNAEEVEAGFATVRAEIETQFQGAGPEVISSKIAEHRSVYRAAVAEQLGVSDPIAAQEYVDEYASEILPEAETTLRTRLRPRFDEAMVEGALAEVLDAPVAADQGAPPENPQEGVYTPGNAPTGEGDPAPVQPAPTQEARVVDPLRGRGSRPVAGGQYGASRGTRSHGGIDYPAAEGTPVYAPAPGRVIASWYDREHGGGNSVVVEHPDGRRTGYAHLRNRAVAVGDEVNGHTVLGGVGNTGRSSGPHLHFTVRDADGNRVDPETQRWGGAGSLPARTPRREELGDMYARARRVAEERGLSPSQYRDLLTGVDREYARNERVLSSEREIAADTAWESVNAAEEAGQPVNLSTVPGYEDMDPQQRRALRAYVQNGEGRDGSDTYYSLFEMSSNPATQQRFAQTDLNQYRGRISESEYRELVRDQQAIRHPGSDRRGRGGSGTGRTARAVAISRVDDAIRILTPEIGLDQGGTGRQATQVNSRNRARLARLVRNGLARWQEQNPGAEVPDDVIDFYVRQNSQQVFVTQEGERVRTRMYGITNLDERTRFTPDPGQVPARDRTQIREAFRRQHGRLPTEFETVALYNANR